MSTLAWELEVVPLTVQKDGQSFKKEVQKVEKKIQEPPIFFSLKNRGNL